MIYTKERLGHELQAQLLQGKDYNAIAKWAFEIYLDYGLDFENGLDYFVLKLIAMEEGPVEELNLFRCKYIPNIELLTIKKRLPHLKMINLGETNIASLEGLPSQIEELNLYTCSEIPQKEFLTIKERFPYLKKINLGQTNIADLKGLPFQIEKLNLIRCNLPKEEFLTLDLRFPYLIERFY